MRALFRSLLTAGLALAVAGCGYNEIQRRDEAVNRAEGQIKVQLQRRSDLIPNLVETVKGFARQESTVFVSVAEARAKLSGAVQGPSVAAMGEANQALTGALGRLLAIAEQYPELKSNQNFLALQDQLEGTENRVGVARQDYNQAVQAFNSYVRQFPYNLTAKLFGMARAREYFELTDPGAAAVPAVKF